MKKLIPIILALVLVIGAVAYGNYAKAETNTPAKVTITTEADTTTEADSTTENGSIAEADAAADSDIPTENGTTTPTVPDPNLIPEVRTPDGEYTLSFFPVTSQEPNSVSYATCDDILNTLWNIAAANPKEAGEVWLVENCYMFSAYDLAFYTVGGNWALRFSTMGEANEIKVESITIYGYEEDADHTITNALSNRRVLRKVEGVDVLEEFRGKDGLYEGHDHVSLILPDIDNGCRVTAVDVTISIDGIRYDINMANWSMMFLPPC